MKTQPAIASTVGTKSTTSFSRVWSKGSIACLAGPERVFRALPHDHASRGPHPLRNPCHAHFKSVGMAVQVAAFPLVIREAMRSGEGHHAGDRGPHDRPPMQSGFERAFAALLLDALIRDRIACAHSGESR